MNFIYIPMNFWFGPHGILPGLFRKWLIVWPEVMQLVDTLVRNKSQFILHNLIELYNNNSLLSA